MILLPSSPKSSLIPILDYPTHLPFLLRPCLLCPAANFEFFSCLRVLTPLLYRAFNIPSRWCPTVQPRCNNRPPLVTRKHLFPPSRLTSTRKTDNQLLYPVLLTEVLWLDWFPKGPAPESLPSSTQAAGSTWDWASW